ncbi:hypothetical protein SAMN04489713_111337 [Actinomadura madurae]|uniref:Uncharacterized protein n=1 Tax=Actinomadura madurae TaxID=1993 RepID=A0A1I5MMG0_9ACTN|nr:hypothetical protein [Actinomadura madurae]SFP10487.1 hypothetical protein SAMN04489713_111337 [Actinomadura madurae]
MSDHTEPGRPDDRTAERLLDGGDGPAALRALLSAAAAPGRPEELGGEDAAVAAFLAAPRPARRHRAADLRRFLTAKIIAAVGGLILLLSGGVAYATGNFPGQEPAPSPSPTRSEHKGRGGDSTPATHGSRPPGTSPAPGEPGAGGTPGARKSHGRANAPGQQKKTAKPRTPVTPPKGPGNNNGSSPGANSGNGSGNGNGAGGGNGLSPQKTQSGSGNGTVDLDGADDGGSSGAGNGQD